METYLASWANPPAAPKWTRAREDDYYRRFDKGPRLLGRVGDAAAFLRQLAELTRLRVGHA